MKIKPDCRDGGYLNKQQEIRCKIPSCRIVISFHGEFLILGTKCESCLGYYELLVVLKVNLYYNKGMCKVRGLILLRNLQCILSQRKSAPDVKSYI